MASRTAKRTPQAGESAPDPAAEGNDVGQLLDDWNAERVAAVHRAGGHVDRGDGRGWVLDEQE